MSTFVLLIQIQYDTGMQSAGSGIYIQILSNIKSINFLIHVFSDNKKYPK